ncbi:GNAT family N-acetyltransferase [Nocardiopsis composta]
MRPARSPSASRPSPSSAPPSCTRCSGCAPTCSSSSRSAPTPSWTAGTPNRARCTPGSPTPRTPDAAGLPSGARRTGRLRPDRPGGHRARGARAGLARLLLAAALERVGDREVRLDAQAYATGLYRSFGFAVCGPEFTEDGIAHVPMVRSSSAAE